MFFYHLKQYSHLMVFICLGFKIWDIYVLSLNYKLNINFFFKSITNSKVSIVGMTGTSTCPHTVLGGALGSNCGTL